MTRSTNYKLCILCAGRGTRVTLFRNLHKAFLPVGDRSALSRVVESVPNCDEIVLAVGHRGEEVAQLAKVIIKQPLRIVHVDNFDGPGSGPGYSLLQCAPYLQCPFVFTSVDTIIEEKVVDVDEDWIGVQQIDPVNAASYCLVKGDHYLESLYFGAGDLAYIGMAGIKNYNEFWDALLHGVEKKGEHQVLDGFNRLSHVALRRFTWHDTGNDAAYQETEKHFPSFVLPKRSETIFFEGDRVVKYFEDAQIVADRAARSLLLKGAVPQIHRVGEYMYYYDYSPGLLLSSVCGRKVFRSFLRSLDQKFPEVRAGPTFADDCREMYQTKTFERIRTFEGTTLDTISQVNGVDVEPVADVAKRIPWEDILATACPSYFHGDLQPENIIVGAQDFVFLDWRQRFGSSLDVGDRYYDLSKLHHACIVSNEAVRRSFYRVDTDHDTASIEIGIRSNLLVLEDELKRFCAGRYSWWKVELLSALHYLNIASLYKGLYRDFLFLYGKLRVTELLDVANRSV